jgi:hypothetical protein
MQTSPSWSRTALTLILVGAGLAAAGCDRRPADSERPSMTGQGSTSSTGTGGTSGTASNETSNSAGTGPNGSASSVTR